MGKVQENDNKKAEIKGSDNMRKREYLLTEQVVSKNFFF